MDIPPIFMKPKRKAKGTVSPLMTIVLLVPIVLFVFASGVYLGMSMVSGSHPISEPIHDTDNPRTTSSLRLRGAMPLESNLPTQSLPPAPPAGSAGKSPAGLDTLGNMRRNAPMSASAGSVHGGEANTNQLDGNSILSFKRSLHSDGISHFKASSSLDSNSILVGAWVHLDDTTASHSMRTIFSNKQAGCGADRDRYGISMYINEWETSNQILYVEYGSTKSGCEKINSGTVKVLPNRWYHVAVSFISNEVVLFLDGVEVNRVQGNPHEAQASNKMVVGQYDEEGSFALIGNISHFAVVHIEMGDIQSSSDIVRNVMDPTKVEKTPGLYSLFRFTEASFEDRTIAPIDAMKRTQGEYKFASRGRFVADVKVRLRDGTSGKVPTQEEIAASDIIARERRKSVKEGMKRSWKGYKSFAWGSDELKPASKRGSDNWGGMGVTLVDSLDTLWVMDMKTEFHEAVEWVKSSLSFDRAGTVSTFETTIRELGGLLSAYDLSGEKILLEKAEDLGNRLSRAFNTASGIPSGSVNLNSGAGAGRKGGSAVLSELGTLQVEFRYLAAATNKKEFETKAMKPFQVMRTKHPNNGLYPIKVSTSDGSFVDRHVTFGALGDSFYEYLLKVWIQGGKKETWLRQMYDDSINGVMDVLLKTTKKSGLAYISDWDGRSNIHKMDHLVCFMPGILALGSVTDPRGPDSPRAERDMSVAKALMFTCRYGYISVNYMIQCH